MSRSRSSARRSGRSSSRRTRSRTCSDRRSSASAGRILEPNEVPRVSKAFSDERAQRVFLTLALTGLRRSELVGLRWRHVNLVEGTLRVEESKSEEGERLIALPGTLVDALTAQFTFSHYRSDEDFVFAHPERGTRLDADWYRARFREALAEAGVEGQVRTFHDMRHTALTNLAATGASPVAIMATAGHRSMQTTKGYLHLAGVTFAEEAEALERRLLGTGEPSGSRRAPSDQAHIGMRLNGLDDEDFGQASESLNVRGVQGSVQTGRIRLC